MSRYIITDKDDLNDAVKLLLQREAFSFDIEADGEFRGVPHLCSVSWISLASDGITCTVPMGHPIGSRQLRTRTEPKLCTDGKIRNYRKPVWEPPPVQLDRSYVFGQLRPLFLNDRQVKVAADQTVDSVAITKYLGEVPWPPYDCVITMDWLLDENRLQHGVKPQVKDYFGYVYDRENTGRAIETFPFSKVGHYSAMDAMYEWFLYKRHRALLEADPDLAGAWQLERDLMSTLIGMRLAGADVDEDIARRHEQALAARLEQHKAAIYKAAGRTFNINSVPEKQSVLYSPRKEGGQGLKPWKLTDGGKKRADSGARPGINDYSTDDDVLQSYPDNPLCSAMRDYGDVHKLLGTYIQSWLGRDGKPSMIHDGRIHTWLKQYGTVTGRLSSSAPNLQNCLDAETEVLTPGGWVRFPDLADGEEVAQWSPDGRITFVVPSCVHRVPYDGNLVFQQASWGSFAYTPDHRVISKTRNGVLREETAAEWQERWGGESVSIERSFIRAGITSSRKRLTPTGRRRLAVAVAVQAEGSKCTDWKDHYALVFRSDRKIAQARELFGSDGKVRASGKVAFYVHQDSFGSFLDHSKEKNFIAEAILWLCQEDLEFFLGEVQKWDGSWSRKEESYGQKPVRSASVDVVQAACCLTGRSTSRYVRNHFDVVNIHPKAERYASRCTIKLRSYSGMVYCVTVPSGMFIIRRSGTPLVTGNCPRPDSPDGKLLRSVFRAPAGYKMIVADYGQIELVVIAHYIGHGGLYEAFMHGEDPHRKTAAGMFHCALEDVTSRQRQLCKTSNFLISYGGGWQTLMISANKYLPPPEKITAATAREVMELYEDIYPEVEEFKQAVFAVARKRKPPHIRTLIGRKRRMPRLNSPVPGIRAAAERQLFSALIQGSAGDLMKLALIRADSMLAEQLPDAWLVLTIHDEIVAVAPEDQAEKAKDIIVEAMTGPEMQRLIKVPLKVDAKVVDRWADAKS